MKKKFAQLFLFILLSLLLFTKTEVFAQSTPEISVNIIPAEAEQGDSVTIEVWVLNGVNIAGVDVGIEVDSCLRIIGKQQGAYLPDAANGGFTVFDQTTDSSARLAVAITDRTANANNDDIFFTATAEVLCESGVGTVTVPFAELSAYADPLAEQIELIAYLKDSGTLLVPESIQIEIISSIEEVEPTPEPIEEVEPTIEPVEEAEPTIESVEEAEPAIEPADNDENDGVDAAGSSDVMGLLTSNLPIVIGGGFLLLLLLFLMRRRRR